MSTRQRMKMQILISLISLVSGIAITVVTQLTTHIMDVREAKQLENELSKYKKELVINKKKYDDLLKKKEDQPRRGIDYQLTVLKNQIERDSRLEQHPIVEILGTNGLGPLHQGREILIDVLNKGGKVRILLLDPESKAFQGKRDDEEDEVGRMAAESLASFYILSDILKQVGSSKSSNLELRLHEEKPTRSLIMVDADRDDGVIIENPYPGQKGLRGVEGEMWTWHKEGKEKKGYYDNKKYFKEIWHNAKALKISGQQFQAGRWPYEKVPKNGKGIATYIPKRSLK